MVFRPIMDMTTDDVWLLLLQRTPPWGGSHRELVTLYRNAQGGECPLVIDKSQAPSCGTSSSRFGCWTCTVVEKDRSMEGFIDAGYENMEPLMEFRDWLAKFRNERSKRMVERRDGRIVLHGRWRHDRGRTVHRGSSSGDPGSPARGTEGSRDASDLHDEIARIKALWADDAVEEAKRHLKQREQLARGSRHERDTAVRAR